jgi:hypothetical protein
MKRLRFGALVLAYNQEDYLGYCIRALAPHVDAIAVAHSDAPWTAYNPHARSEFATPDGTRDILDSLASEIDNLGIVTGLWNTEEAMRNAGLDLLRQAGMDVCLIVDADEFYPESGIARLRDHIERENDPGRVYFGAYRACYKRFDYIVESDHHRVPVAVHLDADTTFLLRRLPSGHSSHVPDPFYFWHLGYVLSDQRMWEKLHTFGHAHEVVPRWFEEKWLNWTPSTRDLFRKEPRSRWPRTLKIDPSTLPAILHAHPYFPNGDASDTV